MVWVSQKAMKKLVSKGAEGLSAKASGAFEQDTRTRW